MRAVIKMARGLPSSRPVMMASNECQCMLTGEKRRSRRAAVEMVMP